LISQSDKNGKDANVLSGIPMSTSVKSGAVKIPSSGDDARHCRRKKSSISFGDCGNALQLSNQNDMRHSPPPSCHFWRHKGCHSNSMSRSPFGLSLSFPQSQFCRQFVQLRVVGSHCALVTTISHKEGGRSFPIPKTPGQSNSQFRQGVSRQPTPPTSPPLP